MCASLPALRDPDEASRAWCQDFGALVGALAPSVRLERTASSRGFSVYSCQEAKKKKFSRKKKNDPAKKKKLRTIAETRGAWGEGRPQVPTRTGPNAYARAACVTKPTAAEDGGGNRTEAVCPPCAFAPPPACACMRA